jgi:hypothetical protein
VKKLFLFTFPVLLLLCGCDLFSSERKLKPYDPKKAGATIVKSYNITGQIKSFGGDVAEYNNAIYINNNGVINIFDKSTFEKINEIKLILPIGIGVVLNVHGGGLAITADGHAFLLCSPSGPLYFIDLSTGITNLFDDFTSDNFNFGDAYIDKMGYNKTNDTIWFKIRRNYEPYYLFYKFDESEGHFLFLEQKDASLSNYRIASIYGNMYWLSGWVRGNTDSDTKDVYILKYSFENPEKLLHRIDVEYLNTLTLTRSVHYDGEYVWLMVERNNQIQMLKLRPHG